MRSFSSVNILSAANVIEWGIKLELCIHHVYPHVVPLLCACYTDLNWRCQWPQGKEARTVKGNIARAIKRKLSRNETNLKRYGPASIRNRAALCAHVCGSILFSARGIWQIVIRNASFIYKLLLGRRAAPQQERD